MKTAELLNQDKVWIDRFERVHVLDEMDPKYRSNIIPFLRGNANALQRAAEAEYYGSALASVHDPSDGVADAMDEMEGSFLAPAEEWLEQTPLMRRLVALEQGIPLMVRKRWAIENKAYEIRHGYKKVRHG